HRQPDWRVRHSPRTFLLCGLRLWWVVSDGPSSRNSVPAVSPGTSFRTCSDVLLLCPGQSPGLFLQQGSNWRKMPTRSGASIFYPGMGRVSRKMLRFFKKRAFRSEVGTSLSYLVGFANDNLLQRILRAYPGIWNAVEGC